MNYFHVLTILFVLLKVFNVITWSWWLVFAPSIISFGVAILIFSIIGVLSWLATK